MPYVRKIAGPNYFMITISAVFQCKIFMCVLEQNCMNLAWSSNRRVVEREILIEWPENRSEIVRDSKCPVFSSVHEKKSVVYYGLKGWERFNFYVWYILTVIAKTWYRNSFHIPLRVLWWNMFFLLLFIVILCICTEYFNTEYVGRLSWVSHWLLTYPSYPPQKTLL